MEQKAGIKAFAELEGYQVKRYFREVGSGRKPPGSDRRTQLKQVLKLSQTQRCPILVWQFSRISRSQEQLEQIERSGVKILSVTEGSLDSASAAAQGAAAEARGNRLSELAHKSNEKRCAAGQQLGNTASLEQHRTRGHATMRDKADEFAQKVLPIIEKLQADHHAATGKRLTLAGIAALDMGVAGAGGRWHAATVKRLQSARPVKRSGSNASQRQDGPGPLWAPQTYPSRKIIQTGDGDGTSWAAPNAAAHAHWEWAEVRALWETKTWRDDPSATKAATTRAMRCAACSTIHRPQRKIRALRLGVPDDVLTIRPTEHIFVGF